MQRSVASAKTRLLPNNTFVSVGHSTPSHQFHSPNVHTVQDSTSPFPSLSVQRRKSIFNRLQMALSLQSRNPPRKLQGHCSIKSCIRLHRPRIRDHIQKHGRCPFAFRKKGTTTRSCPIHNNVSQSDWPLFPVLWTVHLSRTHAGKIYEKFEVLLRRIRHYLLTKFEMNCI